MTTTPPKRPNECDREIIAIAVEMNKEALMRWLRTYDYGAPWEELKPDVCEAIRSERDAYKQARYLEDKCWDTDANLVEILDNISCDKPVEAATKVWVAVYGIEPQFAVGDRVFYHTHRTMGGSGAGDIVSGTIIEIRRETAEYLIREDSADPKSGTPIVYFEHTYPVDPTVAA